MSFLTVFYDTISPFFPLLETIAVVGLVLWIAHRFLIGRHPELGNEHLFPRQLIMLGLTFGGILAIVLAIPVSESSRNQIIGLMGLLISGIFAFSSSTIFANLMAGIMLRVTKPFPAGDFVTVDDYFGRVVERGLFDTEIQTENRELVAFPNTYMINTPLTVTRNSGTVIATTLSLGYDIHHSRVESLLLDAAEKCGLEAPFVQILELGDYSITYKISGILTEVESLLTARSNLYRSVLDTLHGNSIEIVSPAFMNQRRVADETKIIPEKLKQKIPENVPVVEDIVFDKADKAGQIETEKQILLDKIQQYEIDLEQAPKDERKLIQQKIDDCKQQLESNQKINEAKT